jgi:hypothetical protein
MLCHTGIYIFCQFQVTWNVTQYKTSLINMYLTLSVKLYVYGMTFSECSHKLWVERWKLALS